MIEKEKKVLLTEEEFRDILKYLMKREYLDKIIQINYYYDTSNFDVFKNNETLRIRQKRDRLYLEYKFDKTYSGNFRNCKEFKMPIIKLPFNIQTEKILWENIKKYRQLELVGNMLTERHNFYFSDAVISLDCNYYLGIKDYELEIEFKGNGLAAELWWEELGLVDKENAEGKYSRFIERLTSIKINK